VQDAIDWLDKNADKSVEEIKAADAPKTSGDDEESEAKDVIDPGDMLVANSLQCKECGKKFRTHNEATFHANKSYVCLQILRLFVLTMRNSGHADFEESTEAIAPLTAEEKAARLNELRTKIAAKRAGTSEQDKEDQKKNEEIRRKSTREGQDVREALQTKERIKEAEKKRAEKKADVDARKKILAQIEADKADRKRKSDMEKAARRGETLPMEEEKPVVAAPKAASSSTATEARLRLQSPQGMLTKTFPVETTLFQVAQYIQEEQNWEPTEFTTNFPKKTYSGVDFGLSLKEAGLVPSAALVLK
jgi:UBX domain-containing protein 1/4